MPRTYDLLSIGRCSIDLYANDIGAPFEEITSFAALVGGCPTNIAVGSSRLGLRAALMTGLGDDKVGDFVRHFLDRERIELQFTPVKHGRRTPAVLLGIQPPDHFPLIFYRDAPPDADFTFEDMDRAPIADSRVILISGTGLSRDPARCATVYAAEKAQASGTEVILDLDFRADQWFDPRAYGVVVRQTLPLVDIAIGNEAELLASTGATDAAQAIARLLGGVRKAVIFKKGEAGCAIHTTDGSVYDIPPFRIQVLNVLGAGDAFAAGFIYGYLNGWGWQKSGRIANANGAIVVTRQGCANDMPTLDQTLAFIEEHGGF